MKKTNVALLRNVRLAKVLPLFFAFFVVSAVQLNAQSFLPLNDALELVKDAITDKQETVEDYSVASTTSAISSSDKQELFTWRYMSLYYAKADELKDLELALEAIDGLYNTTKERGEKKDLIENARQELMSLITE